MARSGALTAARRSRGSGCTRLDGPPLAIELAACRVKLLSPVAILARLGHSLGLGASDLDRPSRQQTLRDNVAWSYDLLEPDMAGVFRRAGVFAGGCDLDACYQARQGPAAQIDQVCSRHHRQRGPQALAHIRRVRVRARMAT